ncbi:MAG: UDP-N-acetylmuramate--L-alanine ligase [Lachnospiraceae bacterium]|nr:UDP-N-acetylmuramate--L-alanine ligase [Lachnospiraceae bacterium]
MYQIDPKHPASVHFIGIGGISMSAIATLLKRDGFTVSGSDSRESELTKELESQGIRIYIGQKAENLDHPIDVVVYTAAIHPDNPEFAACKEKNLPLLTRGEILGQIMAGYKHAVGIAGTHGKTTTTSMVSQVLLDADTDPTLFIGGFFGPIKSNIRIGGSEYLAAEACEYTNSFLSMQPTDEIILNIEEDHLDFFKDLEDIRHSFRRFADLIPERGALVINAAIPRLEELTKGLSCKIITYSSPEKGGEWYPENITFDERGYAAFDVMHHTDSEEVCLGHISLEVPGIHNVGNALAAFALCDSYGIPAETVCKALSHFSGAKRRFELKGTKNGVTVIDDYAHHPTEIATTLASAARYPHKRVVCVFQPHTYTRTKELFDDFAEVLSHADQLVLAPIYAARETDTLGVSSDLLAEAVKAKGSEHVISLPSFDEILKFLSKNCINGDLLITVGAGDVDKIGDRFLEE